MNKNIVTPEMKRDQKKFLNETEKMYKEMKKAYIQDLMTLNIRLELYKTTSPSYHTSPNYRSLRKCIVNTIYKNRNNTN